MTKFKFLKLNYDNWSLYHKKTKNFLTLKLSTEKSRFLLNPFIFTTAEKSFPRSSIFELSWTIFLISQTAEYSLHFPSGIKQPLAQNKFELTRLWTVGWWSKIKFKLKVLKIKNWLQRWQMTSDSSLRKLKVVNSRNTGKNLNFSMRKVVDSIRILNHL